MRLGELEGSEKMRRQIYARPDLLCAVTWQLAALR